MPSRVLIVDDSRIVRNGVCRLFTSGGFSVCGEAEDGRQAIEEALKLRPDLIVLDFSMPVMDGVQAAKALKQIMPDVPIILFTGHASVALEGDAFAAGISAVLSKDRDISDLVTEAHALLVGRRTSARTDETADSRKSASTANVTAPASRV